MKIVDLIWLVPAFLILGGPANAAEKTAKPTTDGAANRTPLPTVKLMAILESVSSKSGTIFLTDSRVRADVVVGTLGTKDINYSSLLTILRNNGLAAVPGGEAISIMPVGTVRQYALQLLTGDDKSIDADEWVTRIVHLKNTSAAQLVPIMRPLMPQAGHLAAHPASNAVLIADRYSNVLRITELMLKLDALTPQQTE